MLWFKAQRRIVMLGAAVAAAAMLSACSGLTPVFGTANKGPQALRQSVPASVAEQVIYQSLAVSFPVSRSDADPELRVTTSTAERTLTMSNVSRPTVQREMVVTAIVQLADSTGKVTQSFSRSAAASFETDSQSFASDEARREATERAARALAETIRLSLLAVLSGNPG